MTDTPRSGWPPAAGELAWHTLGGIDAVSTRERYPRIAELPFDAACKLMATFHRMKSASGREVIRCFVKGAPDQLLPRAATVVDADAGPAPADGEFRQRYEAENQRLGEQGLRVISIAARTSTRPPSTPPSTCSRWSPGWSCSPWPGSSTRPTPQPGHRSRRRRRPASGSG
jgi:P-type Ca2+ transporter type 2C